MKKESRKRQLTALAILLGANFLFFLTVWLAGKYDQVYVDQLIFQLKSSSEGIDGKLMNSATVRVGLFGVVMTIIEVIFFHFASRLRMFKNRALAFSLAILLFSTLLFDAKLNVLAYFDTAVEESDFIEDHYVNPREVSLKFPAQKRNLIYIFLESMENTFADTTAGEPITADYIPHLTALTDQNINFSNTAGLGGAYSYLGTTWTAAAMATQTCGVPVKMELTADEDAYGAGDDFLPGITSIGEILANEGYKQCLLVGSDQNQYLSTILIKKIFIKLS